MIEMNWFLPTGGDSRDVLPDDSSINRAPSHTYLAQIARACEDLGFNALLTPCGTGCEDAWLATASLIALISTCFTNPNLGRTNGQHISTHV
jgi:alkanesulfonate monooxygenase